MSVPQRDASNEQNSPIDWPAMPILESVCVTLDPDGTAHAAPLGPRVNVDDPPDRPTFQLRPYDGSATAANLLRTGQATIHATDDAALFVDLVLKASQPPTAEVPHLGASHRRLVRCHRWFAIEVTDRGFTPPLHHLIAKTVASGVNDPFFGFNRAKAALIELAIAATRLSRLDSSGIDQQIETLAPQVEKTACPADRAAWDRLVEHLRRQRA